MDAHRKIREHISALGDGELATGDLELAVAALRSPDGAQAWSNYHLIGDALRAPAAPEFSPGFNERLAERLAAEPLSLRRAPVVSAAVGVSRGGGGSTASTAGAASAVSETGAGLEAAGGTSKVATTP